jgi:hypothetical protein
VKYIRREEPKINSICERGCTETVKRTSKSRNIQPLSIKFRDGVCKNTFRTSFPGIAQYLLSRDIKSVPKVCGQMLYISFCGDQLNNGHCALLSIGEMEKQCIFDKFSVSRKETFPKTCTLDRSWILLLQKV